MRRRRADAYYTLDEVAAVLGCSKERARQIEVAALQKLRRAFDVQGLTLDDLLPESLPDDGWERMPDDRPNKERIRDGRPISITKGR